MRFKRLKKKSWSDESGVSEIVGNILILMITVILFTGIMAFVNQMPVPELSTKADFSARITFESLGSVANLNVTHVGGVPLDATDVTVLVSVDDVLTSIKLSDDPGFVYDTWTTGTEWSKTFTGTSYSSIIIVTVVDDVKHSAIWVSQVTGGTGGNPPIVLQRYVDSNPLTETADVVKEYDDFSFFCKITDLDGDLDISSVYIDSSSIPSDIGGSAVDTPDDIGSTGSWFRWDFEDVLDEEVAVSQLDGKMLYIYASDEAGHTTISSFKMSVTVLPVDLTNIYTPIEVGSGGLPAYLTFVNDRQGWGLYGERINETYPNGVANVTDARTNFTKGERIYIRVASLDMNNVFGRNDLTLIDTRTGVDCTSFIVWESELKTSTAQDPFYAYASGGNVYVYQAVLNTTNMFPSAYHLNVDLASSGSTNYVFHGQETITIEEIGSTISYVPKIFVYKDDGYTDAELWGTTMTKPFNVSGSDYMVYVSMKVQDTGDPNAASIGEIRMVDMTGNNQLYGPEGAYPMIGDLTLCPRNGSTYYSFWIDLRFNNGDQWRAGINSYTLQISRFSDSNEGVYSFSRQVVVKASSVRADFIAGMTGIYSSKGGSTNFINPWYVTYTENNNFFTTRLLQVDENSPSTAPTYYYPGMAIGDFDGDGDMDLIAGQNLDKTGSSYDDQGLLMYFENSMNEFGTWQAPSIIYRPADDPTGDPGDEQTDKIEWIAAGDINNDGDVDFAYSTGNDAADSWHQVFIYNNTYGSGGKRFINDVGDTNGGIRKIALEDMNGDGCADLIVLSNGRVRVYDLARWSNVPIASIPSNTISPSNIWDFDIADVNGDGMLDILTAATSSYIGTEAANDGIDGVWVNTYTEKNGDARYIQTLVAEAAGHTVVGSIGELDGVPDGIPYSIAENSTSESSPWYSVNYTLKMDTLSAYTDPQLVVRAKVKADAQEVFYVWYSTDADGTTGSYTPVIVVRDSSYTTYRYNLPASVANAPNFYVRITDSSSSDSSTFIDQIDVDYIAVESDRFGGYYPGDLVPEPSRYMVVSGTPAYTCVRAAELDGDATMEVIVAKNSQWAAYDHDDPIPGWDETNAHFFVTADDLSDSVEMSPSLFQVEDINGDT